jgi:hypothetical protein
VLGFWQKALASAWGEDGNVASSIQIHLRNFEHWDTEGVVDLLRELLERSPDKDFLGVPIGRLVDHTGRDLDLLWQFITKDVPEDIDSRIALRARKTTTRS